MSSRKISSWTAAGRSATRQRRRFAAAGMAIAGVVLSSVAYAASPVALKADITDTDGIVTLGDLFHGAGAAGRTPVATRSGASVMLNAYAVRQAALRAGLDWPNAEGLRQIVVLGGPGAGPAAAVRGKVDVLTWTRNIAAGEIVQPQDLIWGKAATAPADAPSDADAVIGLVARRPLRAGAAVAAHDVSAPQVVKANEMVTVTFQDSGVSLALQARAIAGGAVGETISVQNVTSKKIVQAVVTGPGQAAVGPPADQLKLSRSTRVALR